MTSVCSTTAPLGWRLLRLTGCRFIMRLVGVAAGRTGKALCQRSVRHTKRRVDESPPESDWSAAQMSFSSAHLTAVQAQTFTFSLFDTCLVFLFVCFLSFNSGSCISKPASLIEFSNETSLFSLLWCTFFCFARHLKRQHCYRVTNVT